MDLTDPLAAAGPYRLIFADIDGTLVDGSGVMSPRTIVAIGRACSLGRTMVLCTGRSRHAAQRVARELGGDGYGIVLNGAVVLAWHAGSILRRSLVPAHLIRGAVNIARGLGLAAIWLGTEETDNHQYAERAPGLWPEYLERNGARIHLVDDLAALPEPPASLVAYGREQDAAALARAWREALGPEVSAVAGPTAVYRAWYAQLTAAEATKESAAAFLAEYLNVPREQTMAIGDHVNDVGLLKWAGLGVCMGDGDAAARAAADRLTASLEEDGAALALERLDSD